ncbi:MAG: hypothetical protein IPL79_12960 [Myxococcales bacterium]|nr:hypothetical protein [Myxococcales bacterium]
MAPLDFSTPPSILAKLLLAAGVTVSAVYGGATLLGKDFKNTQRQVVPASVRNAPGGYRSFHFWHSGYSGGK